MNDRYVSWKNKKEYQKNMNDFTLKEDIYMEEKEEMSLNEIMIRNNRPRFDSQVNSSTVFGTADKYIPWKDKVPIYFILFIFIFLFLFFYFLFFIFKFFFLFLYFHFLFYFFKFNLIFLF